MDQYEALVGEAVLALRSGEDRRITSAITALSVLGTEELLAELCVWIDEYSADTTDYEALLATTALPVPDRPVELLDAVARNDLQALFDYANGELLTLIASMLALTASLQEARERTAV